MMRYRVKEDDYADLICYQIARKNSRPLRFLSYIGTNILFWAFAIYFLIDRKNYSTIIRMIPLFMALIGTVTSTLKRRNSRGKARLAVKDLIGQNQLSKDFFSYHCLAVKGENLELRYGNTVLSIPCSRVSGINKAENMYLIMEGGKIFDLIPLKENDEKIIEREIESLNNGISTARQRYGLSQIEKLDAEMAEKGAVKLSWESTRKSYLKSLVEGHRKYFTYRKIWLKGHQIIRIVLLLYGVFMLISRWNIYFGIIFSLVGIYLNRHVFITYSPLAYLISGKNLGGSELGDDLLFPGYAYVSETEMIVMFAGLIQRGKLMDIRFSRSGKNHYYIYTNSGQMMVIDRKTLDNHPMVKKSLLLSK